MNALTLCSQMARGSSLILALTLLSQCTLPPREAWRVVQRDGLFTYLSGDYGAPFTPNRYLAGQLPAQPPRLTAQVPYRPSPSQNRYIASDDTPQAPYRPKTRGVSKPKPRSEPREERLITRAPASSETPAPAPKTTAESPVVEAAKPSMETLPYGTPVAGRPGMVTSPFAQKQQLVDVTGMAAGEAVKDPYSGKLFRVPPTQQAAAEKTEPLKSEEVKPKP